MIHKQNRSYKYKTVLYVYGEDNSLKEKEYVISSPIRLRKQKAEKFSSDIFSHESIEEFRYYNQGDVFYIGNDVHSGSFLNQNNYSPDDFFNVNYPELMMIYRGENYQGKYWKEVITKEIIYGYLVKGNGSKEIFDKILTDFEKNNKIRKDSVVIKERESSR